MLFVDGSSIDAQVSTMAQDVEVVTCAGPPTCAGGDGARWDVARGVIGWRADVHVLIDVPRDQMRSAVDDEEDVATGVAVLVVVDGEFPGGVRSGGKRDGRADNGGDDQGKRDQERFEWYGSSLHVVCPLVGPIARLAGSVRIIGNVAPEVHDADGSPEDERSGRQRGNQAADP